MQCIRGALLRHSLAKAHNFRAPPIHPDKNNVGLDRLPAHRLETIAVLEVFDNYFRIT